MFNYEYELDLDIRIIEAGIKKGRVNSMENGENTENISKEIKKLLSSISALFYKLYNSFLKKRKR